MQFFGQEKITKLVKASNDVVSLPAGSTTRVGGRAANLTAALNISRLVSGFGGLDTGSIANSTFYYVYLIHNGTNFGLVASTSSASPVGYTSYRKMGAFYTDTTGNIFKVFWYGEVNKLSHNFKVTSGGVVSEEDLDFINLNASLNNTSEYVFAITAAYQTVVAMNLQVEGWNSTAGVIQYSHMALSTVSSITIQMYNGGSRAQLPFQVLATKTGIDAVQPDWSL
jgi:hypothetical protein